MINVFAISDCEMNCDSKFQNPSQQHKTYTSCSRSWRFGTILTGSGAELRCLRYTNTTMVITLIRKKIKQQMNMVEMIVCWKCVQKIANNYIIELIVVTVYIMQWYVYIFYVGRSGLEAYLLVKQNKLQHHLFKSNITESNWRFSPLMPLLLALSARSFIILKTPNIIVIWKFVA